MIAGAYSSVFIATPLLALMREAEPAMREHNAKLARRAARRTTSTPSTPLATIDAAAPLSGARLDTATARLILSPFGALCSQSSHTEH